MNNIQKEIDTLSKYFGRQFLFEGEVWTIQDCKISVISTMNVIGAHFIAYVYRDGVRVYRYNILIADAMQTMIEVG